MKFRSDFVTNSSSSSYVFIGFYSPELLAYLRELIDAGYTYRRDGEETLETKGFIGTNSGGKAVVDALTYIPHQKSQPEKVGFQIELAAPDSDITVVDAIMSFIDPKTTPPKERAAIREKLKSLTASAKKKDQILKANGNYSTDASDFAHHFSEWEYDKVLYKVNRQGTLVSCKDRDTVDAVVYNSYKSIKEKAFQNMKHLKNVTFRRDSYFMNIGASAFAGCELLESINIIKSAHIIEDAAFLNCCSLKEELDFSCADEIGNRAFEGCQSIAEVRNLNRVTVIGDAAFKGCRALKEIDLPERMFEIGADAFAGCPDLVIVCKEGSYAHAYARAYQIPVRFK